jgi:hypothetical protein
VQGRFGPAIGGDDYICMSQGFINGFTRLNCAASEDHGVHVLPLSAIAWHSLLSLRYRYMDNVKGRSEPVPKKSGIIL